jgi:peptide/nickel transport system permease protein
MPSSARIAAAGGDPVPAAAPPPRSSFLRRYARDPLAVVGAVLVLFALTLAAFGPWIEPHDPLTIYTNGFTSYGAPLPPTWRWGGFFLGTDTVGQDELSQLIAGARVSVIVGVLSTALSAALGTLIGLVAGFAGGLVDELLMRLTDVMLAFPFLLFVILLETVVGHSSTLTVVLAIGALGWAGIARLVRGETLALARREFVEAARAMGSPVARILWRHLLPNVLPTIVVFAASQISGRVVLESALSFLGVGVPDPTPSWGKLLSLGLEDYQTSPLLTLWPGLMIALTSLGFNLTGDGLTSALSGSRSG